MHYKKGSRKGEQILLPDGTPKLGYLEKDCPKLTRRDHGSWYYSFELPPGIGGKRQQAKKGGFATQEQAASRAKEVWKSSQAGVNVLTDETVGEFLRRWLRKKKVELKVSTHHEYSRDVDLYFLPHLGHIKIRDLRARQIQAMYDWILEENVRRKEHRAGAEELRQAADSAHQSWRNAPRRTRVEQADRSVKRQVWNEAKAAYLEARAAVRRETGPATLASINTTLKSALGSALKEELIAKNYAALVTLPRVTKAKALSWTPERVAKWKRTGRKPSPVMVWTLSQTTEFLDFVVTDRQFPAWHLILFHGLRRGEAAALTWDEVDLKAGVLHVTEQLVSVAYEVHEDVPKADSVRTIRLNSDSIALLKAWRKEQAREKKVWRERTKGPWGNASNRVFTREDGTQYHPQYFSDRWDRLVGSSGLPPIRLHDGRHEAGSLALAAGVAPKAVQAMLGHSSLRMTTDTYQTVLPELEAASADASLNMMKRARKKKTKKARKAKAVTV
ncbi:tyrosine-type recombinase/integrase [Streptomyces uncialis]|uniref:tyrosine-type recombinase/integrase n=1 Tax=Streptomyces uncialis TaxID=1048205 RepID=UPI0037F58261